MSRRRYTYEVTDVYNVFGGGHCYRLELFRGGRRVCCWDFDSLLAGGLRLRRKITHIEKAYGATRVR